MPGRVGHDLRALLRLRVRHRPASAPRCWAGSPTTPASSSSTTSAPSCRRSGCSPRCCRTWSRGRGPRPADGRRGRRRRRAGELSRPTDAGDLQGRTFLVTGANSGHRPGHGRGARGARRRRDPGRALGGADAAGAGRDPRAHAVRARWSSCRSTCPTWPRSGGPPTSFLASGRALDVLMNNAGVAGTEALSADGFDLTYATNHIGPFLLTNLLLPAIRAGAAGPRGQRLERRPPLGQGHRLVGARAPHRAASGAGSPTTPSPSS